MALVSLLPHCDNQEKLALLHLFSLIAKDNPSVNVNTSCPSLLTSSFSAAGSQRAATLRVPEQRRDRIADPPDLPSHGREETCSAGGPRQRHETICTKTSPDGVSGGSDHRGCGKVEQSKWVKRLKRDANFKIDRTGLRTR
jgi:hypothetical protein